MLGYWEDDEKTHEAIDEDGWMHTGDLAEMREDGYCNIVGRIKDMVIRGGENIYPREIEEFLYTHPDIADVQVIGVPDQRYGEELCAWVKMKGRCRPARRRRGARVRHRQARPLQDPALRDGGRRVPDDGDGQDPEGGDAGASPPRSWDSTTRSTGDRHDRDAGRRVLGGVPRPTTRPRPTCWATTPSRDGSRTPRVPRRTGSSRPSVTSPGGPRPSTRRPSTSSSRSPGWCWSPTRPRRRTCWRPG